MPNQQDHSIASILSGLTRTAAVGVAVVAGVLSIVICALLVVDYARRRGKDPLDSEAFLALKAELAAQPQDEALKQQVRELDLKLRTEYFRHRRFAELGAWLLLAWVAVFLIAIKTASTLRRKLPMPEPQAMPHMASRMATSLIPGTNNNSNPMLSTPVEG